MHGAAQGETNSPGGRSLERSGSCWCENPRRVVPSVPWLAGCVGRGQAGVERDSEAPAGSAARPERRSAWEEPGRNPRPGSRRYTLEGRSPREHPAVDVLILRRSPGTLGRGKAQKPGPVGPAHRFGGGSTDWSNGMWALPCGNARSTFREEKAPKGESQERRRREKKPARARRE
jgi:hypothetical protein